MTLQFGGIAGDRVPINRNRFGIRDDDDNFGALSTKSESHWGLRFSSDSRCSEHDIDMKIHFGLAIQKTPMPGIYGNNVSKCSLAIVGIAVHLPAPTHEI
jgi:hypothetical protein